jgi:hypothetical protein
LKEVVLPRTKLELLGFEKALGAETRLKRQLRMRRNLKPIKDPNGTREIEKL